MDQTRKAMPLNPTVARVTERIRKRSRFSRSDYLGRIDKMAHRDRGAERLGCANVAHAFAALPPNDKLRVAVQRAPNLAIVTSYNDMLSAHAPFAGFPEVLKDETRRQGATAQVAGVVPAMCDGVTQGTPSMELSLFSRDVIAQATAVSLSHDVFDGALLLGICDKIVPGLLIGALHFGHLPTVFVPGGPKTSGLPSHDKALARELAAQGKFSRSDLLEAEQKSYHGPGTCTLDAGLMREDVLTVREGGLREYTREPALEQDKLCWHEIGASRDTGVLRPVADAFSPTGGLGVLTGNLGRAVIKTSAVPQNRLVIEAPAMVFDAQDEVLRAFGTGELERACAEHASGGLVCVVRWQGPRANGMPELHKLTSPLAVLQGRGYRVALVTDGRMSGASGKVPAAIHVSPEAEGGGPLARVRNGDPILVDAKSGRLEVLLPNSEFNGREPTGIPAALRDDYNRGYGRELFANFRCHALDAEQGACTWT